MSNSLLETLPARPALPKCAVLTVERPTLIVEAGAAAGYAWDEFFAGTVRNPHTRRAYRRAVVRLLDWCAVQGADLPRITPGMIGGYLDAHPGSLPTRKLDLAAIRAFLDVLVTRHVIVLNPAASVRGERYQAIEGRTPEIRPDEARRLLAAIPTDTAIGRRDKALVGVLAYTAARAGAVARLRRKDFASDGTRYQFRFQEKGGKARLIPARHDLEQWVLDYLTGAGLTAAALDMPLFRTAVGPSGRLGENGITGVEVWRIVKRWASAAGLSRTISPHSFRVCVVSDLLTQGVPLSDVQFLAGHADPRTTRLYDRRSRDISRNVVERISV